MGIFDFVRNAGAKIGIGKSTDEIAAEEAAAEAAKVKAENEAKAAEMAVKRNKARETMRAKAEARRSAKAKEQREEARKSVELEKYIRDLGLEVKGLDVRYDDGTAFIDGEAVDSETWHKVIMAIGNAEGVERVDEELTIAEDDGKDVEMYVVEKGDTLWAISTAVYGDGNRYNEIFEANKPMLKDPDLIFPGQVLSIPQ